jgi:sugar phosphate isomerase/epimerase
VSSPVPTDGSLAAGPERLSRVPMGLVSLDFDDLGELYQTAEERRLGWVEIYLDVSADESDVDRIAHERDERGIRVVSVSSMAKLSQAGEDEVAEHARLIERSIGLAAATEAPFATFMYGSPPTLDRAAARARFLKRVAPLVELAGEAGVTLLIENVFSRGAAGDLDSVEATLDLFEHLDIEPVGLNFDPANFAIAGEEAFPRAYRELRHLIRYMHLKDVRPVEDGDLPLGDRRVLEDYARGPFLVVPLGAGTYDVAGLVREIADDNRGIVVSLEPTAKGAPRGAWLDASIAFLAAHGVGIEAAR